jgi:RNA 2',3'-cyclic 3'-phosphodiesterase
MPNTSMSLRLFCAIELPADVRAAALAQLTRLRASAPHVKAAWERAEKLHVTLKFFGATQAERLPALLAATGRAATQVSSFALTLEDAGVFPSGRNPRVLWLGVNDAQGHLNRLHRQLEDECAAAGFARDERSFHAHVTLARLRFVNAATRQLADYHQTLGCAPQSFNVKELVLIRSDPGPHGSQYTTIARHALQPI